MDDGLHAPPVLSTPAEHIFEDPTPPVNVSTTVRSEDELVELYEISRTCRELTAGKWTRIALQFPDTMLCDAPWVVGALTQELRCNNPRLYILADTSYSACCVDEIAAEHVGAEVVVHYGRACLSPTARLPVIHVFTRNRLDVSAAIAEFQDRISEKNTKAVVMADVTYQDHVSTICDKLRSRGYTNIFQTSVVHNPEGKLPNRIISSASDGDDVAESLHLQDYSIFHIGTPPTALLLVLSSRVQSLHIMSAPIDLSSSSSDPPPTAAQTKALLGRRYARVLTLATAGIIGILINTLSVANYLSVVSKLKARIAAAGKKSYIVVVGKLNPAKLANFAEVDGWVVVGCWESGLVEDEDFYRPVITPFELDVALTDDRDRVWGLKWWAGIEGVERWEEDKTGKDVGKERDEEVEVEGDEDEDEPPEFDLRTGKLVSKSRPMRTLDSRVTPTETDDLAGVGSGLKKSLVMRTKGEVATIKGAISPGAEYLRTQRTWTGLGSDYTEEASTVVEEGRSGIARGYVVGDEGAKT